MRPVDKLMAHIETWRPYTSFYAGLVALAGATVWRGGLPPLALALPIFLAPVFGWIAALYLCDFFDRELDAFEKPHRPLPSGRLSEREMLVGLIVCMYVGLLASARLGFMSMLLAGGVMVSTIGYSVAKRHALLGNLARGIPTALTVVFGASAVGGAPAAWWIVPVLFFLHDVTTNLVGAIRDVEGDRQGGCETVPVRYGLDVSVRLVIALTLCWEAIGLYLPRLLSLRPDFYLWFLPALTLAIIANIVVARWPGHRPTALLAHKCFVVERMLLSGALIAGAGGPGAALAITLPLIALAQWSQLRLRDRHEFGRPLAHPIAGASPARGFE